MDSFGLGLLKKLPGVWWEDVDSKSKVKEDCHFSLAIDWLLWFDLVVWIYKVDFVISQAFIKIFTLSVSSNTIDQTMIWSFLSKLS